MKKCLAEENFSDGSTMQLILNILPENKVGDTIILTDKIFTRTFKILEIL